ncbi:MAG: hypothetical protein AAFU41_17790 [Pseudomonadota bacterium]
MFRPLIAGLIALSLTLTTAAPAQAEMDREEVGKLLFGLAAIAVIGAALDRRDQEEDRQTEVHETPSWSGINSGSWSDLNRQHQQATDQRRLLPHRCLTGVETRFGTQRMFGRRCLERHYAFASRLPERCAVQVYTGNGPRRGYDPLCLREQGYRSDRRH